MDNFYESLTFSLFYYRHFQKKKMSLLLYYYSSVCTIQYIIFSFPLLVGKAIAVNFIRFSFSFFSVLFCRRNIKTATVKINNKYFLKAPPLNWPNCTNESDYTAFVTEVNCVQREKDEWQFGIINEGWGTKDYCLDSSWIITVGQGKTYFWRETKDDMKMFVVKV